jgi:protein SCO1/2
MRAESRMPNKILLALICFAIPAAAMDIGFSPRPGSQLPMEARVNDDAGRPLTLGAAVDGMPWILALGYFNCPNLCDTVRADLIGALKGVPAELRYRVAVISVDAQETAADARQAQIRDALYLASSGNAWRYLRADAPTLAVIKNAVGFTDRYDAKTRQIAHPAGLAIITPRGKVSGYLLGVGYRADDVTRALAQARRESVTARPPAVIALLCFDYDASTGRYSLAIIKVLRGLAIVSMLIIAVGLLLLFRKPRAAA